MVRFASVQACMCVMESILTFLNKYIRCCCFRCVPIDEGVKENFTIFSPHCTINCTCFKSAQQQQQQQTTQQRDSIDGEAEIKEEEDNAGRILQP